MDPCCLPLDPKKENSQHRPKVLEQHLLINYLKYILQLIDIIKTQNIITFTLYNGYDLSIAIAKVDIREAFQSNGYNFIMSSAIFSG